MFVVFKYFCQALKFFHVTGCCVKRVRGQVSSGGWQRRAGAGGAPPATAGRVRFGGAAEGAGHRLGARWGCFGALICPESVGEILALVRKLWEWRRNNLFVMSRSVKMESQGDFRQGERNTENWNLETDLGQLSVVHLLTKNKKVESILARPKQIRFLPFTS